MAFFIYSTIKPNGNIHIGWRQGYFDHIGSLVQELSNRGELLYKYYRLPGFLSSFYYFFFGNIHILEIAEFCRTISLYRKAGFTEQQAVTDYVDSTKNPNFRRALNEVNEYLTDGYYFDQALSMARVFPDLIVSVARIGRETGHLDQVMEDAALYIERTESIKSTIKRSLIHPLITLLAIVGVITFWLIAVIPQVADLFNSLDVKVPIETEILIAIGEFFGQWWLLILAILLGVPFFIYWLRSFDGPKLTIDKFLWNMPVVGAVISTTQNAFFFQHLALTYKVGVQITRALELVQNTVRNLFFRTRIDFAKASLEKGASLKEAFLHTEIFDALVIRMVGVGERSGNLHSQMSHLSDIYFEKAVAKVDVLKQTLAPILGIVLGIFFAFFMFAALGPVYELITKLPS